MSDGGFSTRGRDERSEKETQNLTVWLTVAAIIITIELALTVLEVSSWVLFLAMATLPLPEFLLSALYLPTVFLYFMPSFLMSLLFPFFTHALGYDLYRLRTLDLPWNPSWTYLLLVGFQFVYLAWGALEAQQTPRGEDLLTAWNQELLLAPNLLLYRYLSRRARTVGLPVSLPLLRPAE